MKTNEPENASAVDGESKRIARVSGDQLRNLAPFPLIDRYPIQLGSAGLSLTSLDAAMKQSLLGYRQRLVDMLDELLDIEPHGASVIQKRIYAVAGSPLEIAPADVDDAEAEKALEVAAFVRGVLDAIPHRTEHIGALLWGIFYGLSGWEILWKREAAEWRIRELQFLHSRRLAFPDYSNWDLYIWDQGQVSGILETYPTQGIRGLRIADWPNKFVIYSPKLRGNYPTREGIGRMLACYWLLKRMVLRIGAQDFERFTKPWVIAYFSTIDGETGNPTPAEREDIQAADKAVKALGAGSLAGVTLPDSIKIEMLKAASNLSFKDFLDYVDAASTKLAFGQTFTTEPGKNGARAAATQGKEDTREIYRMDAASVSEAIRHQLVKAIVELNYPGLPPRFLPKCSLKIDRPDPAQVADLACRLSEHNVPVDGRAVAQLIGLPLAPSWTKPLERADVREGTGDVAGELRDVAMRPVKSEGGGDVRKEERDDAGTDDPSDPSDASAGETAAPGADETNADGDKPDA